MKNIILTDCKRDEIEDLIKGLEEYNGEKWDVKEYISNWGRKNIWLKIKRYLIYFYAPIATFINRKKYEKIIGWQQFYTLIYCFYCAIFHVEKINNVYIVNFTYKEKKGVIGKIYYRFMKYILTSKYVDILFVLSDEYINNCAKIFGISEDKFVSLPFGIPDLYDKYKNSIIEDEFALAIGRSNRDYEWLIKKWSNIKLPLYIISDSFNTSESLPDNVKLFKDISGEKQYPYIMSCKALILPIKIDNICSGDTVLLTGMCFKKNVIVTAHSTLQEMYIINNKNRICR